jgi:hypothetical protein
MTQVPRIDNAVQCSTKLTMYRTMVKGSLKSLSWWQWW